MNDLLEDRSGTLWVGIHDGGLMRVRGGEVTHLTKKDGLADDSVLSLFEDRAGSVWVGTLRGGATRISGGQIASWSTADGLPANHVKVFYEDAAGTLWIGTHGGGLGRFKDESSPPSRRARVSTTTTSFRFWRTATRTCG